MLTEDINPLKTVICLDNAHILIFHYRMYREKILQDLLEISRKS